MAGQLSNKEDGSWSAGNSIEGFPERQPPFGTPAMAALYILSSSDGALFTMTGPFLKRENFTATFDVYCPGMAALSLMFAAPLESITGKHCSSVRKIDRRFILCFALKAP